MTFRVRASEQRSLQTKQYVPPHVQIQTTFCLKQEWNLYFEEVKRQTKWHCKVAPESWGIGGSKVVSSKGLEGYEMFDPRDSRREDREEENA